MKLHDVQISDTWLQLQSNSDGEKFAESRMQCGNIWNVYLEFSYRFYYKHMECILRIFLQVY